MKKLAQLVGLVLLTSTVSAASLEICADNAHEACKEFPGMEYYSCHSRLVDLCLQDFNVEKFFTVDYSCEEYCLTLRETTAKQICLAECRHID